MNNFRGQLYRLRYKISSQLFPCFCGTMDPEENDLQNSQQIIHNYIQTNKDKSLALRKYFKDIKYPPINDFTEGLEWFNVSEPLSFSKHLKGKIVILDFFTYCCINCMHILPDLKEIENEYSIEDGLVVIGVHSAKFENEKQSSNILAAVQRYNVNHPVVNDYKSEMWQNCNIHCWPTLLMLDPNAKPIVMLTGEGHKNDLKLFVANALSYYKEKKLISNHKLPLKSAYHLLPTLKGALLFPGKITSIANGNNCEILAVSDSGNNRILILKNDGTISKCVGGSKRGFKDGTLTDAEFNNPQGLVFQTKDVLYVADTDNHAIRKIDLKKKRVETVAGNGIQGNDKSGGKLWKQQTISSPWDVSIFKTCDLDKSEGDVKDVLLVAMAGTHQIWALFLEDTVWWKSTKFAAGTCVCLAGSGREENRNNQYPHSAGFAQPSGLAVSNKNKEVYIADSESSSVRRLSLVNGKVTPVVGGDRNPYNLFAFGDKDGILSEAKLQHALGLALSKDEKTLYVADTYNHKLKKVDVEKNIITSLTAPIVDTTDGTSSRFSEPAGLCVSSDGSKLYLADTNNHFIKIINLDRNETISSVQKVNVTGIDRTKYQILKSKPLLISKSGGIVEVNFNAIFKNGLKLTEDANQDWSVEVPNPAWICTPKLGTNIENLRIILTVPSGIDKNNSVDMIFNLVTCTFEKCFLKSFIIEVPIQCLTDDSNTIKHFNLEVVLNPSSITLNEK